MAITSMGIGSGIDIKSLVQQLVAAEGQPTTNRLNQAQAKYQSQLSALGSLKGALSTFQSALAGLKSFSEFNKRTATSANADLFTATASGAAVAGTYNVEVFRVATAHSLKSDVFTDTTTSVGAGTLTFQFGDPTKAAKTVTITAGNDSLAGIRDAVNAANIGVQASVVKGDTGYHLVFSSANTGAGNSLKVTVAESPANGTNTDLNGLSKLAYDPAAAYGTGKNMAEATPAVDALVYVNGITVTRASNTITDAIDGVTLTLKKAGAVTDLTVAHDKASVSTAIEGFVKAYNALAGTIKQLSGYDAAKKQGGVLIGDAAVRGITSQMRKVLGNTISGLTGSYRALVDLGIKTQADGTLALDKTKLDSALASKFDEVGRLFAAIGKPTDSLVSYVSSTSSTVAGDYAVSISQAAAKGYYLDAASSVSSTVVDNTNDTFAIKVDGVLSGTITLTQKDYLTKDALAAELQSRINGDSALQAAGSSVAVSYDAVGNRFTFTSSRYGSASHVEITSVESALSSGNVGLTANAAAKVAGVDVAGTIGGVAATGSGQYLTGTGSAAGLKLSIAGSTGARGSVVFSRGVGDQLDSYLSQILATDGFLTQRTQNLNVSLEDIADRRAALEIRLTAIEKRYTTQFAAMDALVAKLNSTSSYLSQHLASYGNK